MLKFLNRPLLPAAPAAAAAAPGCCSRAGSTEAAGRVLERVATAALLSPLAADPESGPRAEVGTEV